MVVRLLTSREIPGAFRELEHPRLALVEHGDLASGVSTVAAVVYRLT